MRYDSWNEVLPKTQKQKLQQKTHTTHPTVAKKAAKIQVIQGHWNYMAHFLSCFGFFFQ